jgi:hypothetical protein
MSPDYYGLPTRSLENEHLKLEYLAEAGPRIVRLSLPNNPINLLAEMPDIHWETPYGIYFVRGGHRLWHSPESFPRTYIPDNEGLKIEELPGGVRLVQPVEAPTGIRKSLEILLDADEASVALHHHLKNEGLWPVQLSPWAITQVPLGGIAVLPQQVGALDFAGLLPNRQLVLWPYTRWNDPRLEFHDDYLLLHGQAHIPPCKVGYTNRPGWMAYLRQNTAFIKRFNPLTHLPHPDFGCNVECYCNDRFLEIETIGPISYLEPGQLIEHTETWQIRELEKMPEDIEGVREVIQSTINKT